MFQQIKNHQNLGITSKLALIIAFPIFGLICFTGIVIWEKRNIINEMNLLQNVTNFAIKSSALIHELQKERGLSVGFLSNQGINNKGNGFAQPLEQQRLKTDQAITNLQFFFKNFDFKAFNPEFKQNQAMIFVALNRLKNQRKQINEFSISIKNEMHDYTQIINKLLISINFLSKIITNVELANQIMVYVNLLQAKEKAGLERAILSNAFSQKQFSPGLYNHFILLVGEQETYLENFHLFATSHQKKRYQQIMQNQFIDEVARIRKSVIKKQLKLKLMMDLRTHLGYGGLIHQFKNYILRGHADYLKNFTQEYQSVSAILLKFKTLPELSAIDLNAIQIIENTFTTYQKYLAIAIELKKQHKSVDEIDALVKINDTPAIQALTNLLTSTHLTTEPHYWWQIATGRINLFKTLEDEFAIDLKNHADTLKKQAQSIFLFYLLLTASMILLTISYTRMILKQTNQAYARFVPNEFLHLLGEDNRLVNIELGHCLEMNMTILFADIRAFTTLSEQMSPQKNLNFINAYLQEMGPIIRQHNGFVDKYIGDAIMALFVNANDALDAAIAMLKQLEHFNQQQNSNTPIKIGIGINTGKLMLGIIGEKNRLQGTVIGDAVNLASRIESLTKTYQRFLIISQATVNSLTHPEQYTINFIDNIKVKGRSGNTNIFEVLDAENQHEKGP